MKKTTYYSAPALAKLLGVNVSTVKRWVDKNILQAEITPGGHRRVSAEALAQFIANQKHLVKKSYIISQMAKRQALSPSDYWEGYYLFLFSNTSLASKNILEEYYIQGINLLDIVEKIILPVLIKIGKAWEQGRLSIYDEHRMTFLLRSDLLRLERMIPEINNPRAPHAVLACVKNENHEIPLLLLHLLLKQEGFKTIILGINTPAKDAAMAVIKNKAKILCLTKSFSKIDEHQYLKTVKFILGQNRAMVALGGSGWKTESHALKNIKKFNGFREFLNKLKK